MRYLKDRRLELVHETLYYCEPGKSKITDIAMKYQFVHMGHFCGAYKKKFGEKPRDTLRYTAL